MMRGVTTSSDPTRSVKISADERTGWSSERPRRDGAPPRLPDISGRCRVLAPSDRLRYSPGSIVIIVSIAPDDPARFADRVVEERGAVLSLAKVRALLAGRVPEEAIEDRAQELLDTAVAKRIDAGQTVVFAAEGLTPEERGRYVRLAHGQRRPRHLILLDTPRDQVADEDRAALNELRKALDAAAVGSEGFQTALRLGGGSIAEVKRIVFHAPPRED
jgi:predicted kinase